MFVIVIFVIDLMSKRERHGTLAVACEGGIVVTGTRGRQRSRCSPGAFASGDIRNRRGAHRRPVEMGDRAIPVGRTAKAPGPRTTGTKPPLTGDECLGS